MSKTIKKYEVVTKHCCLLAEGPVWDNLKKRIIWVDIINGDIHEFYPEERKISSFSTGKMVGSVVLTESGNLIAAMGNGFSLIDINLRKQSLIIDPEPHMTENRFNDGKCDPVGRLWAGTMSVSANKKSGSVYTLENDLSISKKISGVTISNGMAWSLDHTTFYYIDTPTQQVVAYEYDIATGNISHPKTVINVPETEGQPDGMTIDSEGMLWIAMWNGWKVSRWDPNTGKCLESFAFPVAKVSSCTFGGDTLEDLYITSARSGLTSKELEEQPLAGSLFVIKKCGFKGFAAARFPGL